MALTASNVIQAGVVQATPYVREDLVQTGPLLAALTGLDFDAVRQVAIYDPERLASAGSTSSVDTAKNITGYPLSSGIAYGAFTYHKENGSTTPIALVTQEAALVTLRHPGGIVRLGSTQTEFFPSDPLRRAWEGSDGRAWFWDTSEQFSYYYVPMPTQVTSLSQALIAPDECRDWFEHVITALVLEQAMSAFPQHAQIIRERVLTKRESGTFARQEFTRNLVKRVRRKGAYGEGVHDYRQSEHAWVVTA